MMKRLHYFLMIFIVTVSYSQELKVGIPVGHTFINSAQILPSENHILSSGNGKVKVWEIESERVLMTVVGDKAALSPDGKRLASFGLNKGEIWDIKTGELVAELEDVRGNVSGFDFSNDGQMIAAYTEYGKEAKIWGNDGSLLYKLIGHSGKINSISFSTNNRFITTSSNDKTAKIWSSTNGAFLRSLENHSGIVNDSRFSVDGKYLLTSSTDKAAIVWDAKSGKELKRLVHNDNVIAAEFDQETQRVATKSKDNLVRVFQLKDGEVEASLKSEWGNFRGCCLDAYLEFDSKNNFLLAFDAEEIQLFNLENNEIKTFDLPNRYGQFTTAKFSPSYSRIVAGTSSGIITLWDIETGQLQLELKGRTNYRYRIHFDKHENLLVSQSVILGNLISGYSHSIDLWSIADKDSIFRYGGASALLSHITYNPYKGDLVAGDVKGNLYVWNGKSPTYTSTFKLNGGKINDLTFSPNSQKYLASSRKEWAIFSSDSIIQTFSGKSHSINEGVFDKKGTKVLTINNWSGVSLIDLTSSKVLFDLGNRISKPINDAAFDPKGRFIATTSRESEWSVTLWDFEGNLHKKLLGHKFNIVDIAFSPNGEQLVSLAEDRTLKVWDTESFELIHDFKFVGKPHFVFYSKSGKRVLFGAGNDIFVYDTQSGALIHQLSNSDPTRLPLITKNERRLISQDRDGAITIWNLDEGKRLIKTYYFDNDPSKWLHMTSDAYFDASPEAMKLMYWTKGLEIIEFEQLKERYWIPGLWDRIMKGESLPVINGRGLNDVDLYPKIELIHPTKNDGKLGIKLFDQGGGYGSVKILINGKEISSDARGADFDHDHDSVSFTYDVVGHPFLKKGELNTIEVSAYNSEEYVISRPKKLYYVPEGNKEVYEPTLYAIIVGSADYVGEDLDLSFPSKDAHSFSSTLELSAKNLLGSEKTDFRVLTTDDKGKWPSKENIKRAYEEVARTAKPYDAIVLYFAGHGTNYGGVEGDFYYLTADASSGNLKDPVVRKSVAISSDELTDWIKEIPALKQVLIFDACHSGQFAQDLLAKRALRNSSEVKALERMKDRTGMYILSGSAADAVSYEASVYGQGLLTYALLFGMKGASLRENKFVDVVQLFQFAANKVPELARDIGGIQKPEIRVPLGGESFDIGLLESKDRDLIELPNPKPLFVRSSFQNLSTFDDNLELSAMIDERLKNLQESSTPIVFIDASKFSNAYSIRGQYKQKGKKILLQANLLKNGGIIRTYNIKGTTKEQVVEKIIATGLVD